MLGLYDVYQQPVWAIFGLLIISIWTLIWKGLGLWHAAKNKQKKWFVAILLINSLGLLPILYLIWFKKTVQERRAVEFNVKKR
jgi:hypothetical protein